MFRRFYKIILIILLTSTVVFSKDKISGKVTDAKTNEPLVGVNVLVVQSKVGTVTNINGEFEIDNLSDGEYDLKFSYLGYSSVTKRIKVTSEVPININVKLQETAIDLSEVIVTGNPFLVETKDLSQSFVTISKLDLTIKSGGTVADVLNFQPGISVRSNGIATGRPVIRGFSNNKVLILEDGLRMGDLSSASDDHAVSDDGSEAEKIEVIEGPSSLLYGSNAIGGVVNIITDAIPSSVLQGLNGELLLQGATVNNEYLGNAHLNYGFGRMAIHGKFFKRKGEDYKVPGGGTTFNSDINSYGSLFGLSYLPDWGTIGLSYDDYNNKYGLPTLPNADEIVYIDMHKKEYKFLTNINKINSFVTSMSLKAGYLNYNHNEISKLDGTIGTAFGMKTTSADLSFIHKPFIDNSNGILGLYGLFQKYDVNGDEALTPNADYLSLAAYFIEKFNFNPLGLSFGARYEINNVKFPTATLTDSVFDGGENKFYTLSISLGLVYNIDENTSVFTNLANAFRAPTIEELSSYAIHEALLSFDIGNRSLKRENSTGIDLGLRSQGQNYYLQLTGYFNKVNNLIYRQPLSIFYSEDIDPSTGNTIGFNSTGDGFRVHKYNQADADVYGFEAKFSYEIVNGLTSTVVSDYVRAKNITTNENLPLIPPFRFSIDLRYATSKYWFGTTWNLAAAQKDVAPNEEVTAGYGLVGIYAGVKLLTGKFANIINLRVSNMLDQAYKDNLSAIKDIAYMPGRNIILNYKFIF